MSGTCVAEGTPTVRLAFRQQSRVGNNLETHWLGFSISIAILARGHGAGSVDRQCSSSESVLEILLGAFLLVVDNLRLTLLCLCSFVCGCGLPYALLVWWTHIG